ncbi:MAG TPA: ABC transporter permease, partial [Candidatus Luteimonas excrementigallinarum]|nr:ABC transporter permease [Candidatus Luteimonas excrementigallinarum]
MKLRAMLQGLALGTVVLVGLVAWIALPWPVLLALAIAFSLWMLGTRSGRQAGSVTRVGVSTLPQRLGASSVVVVGIAGVVAVLVALLAMAEGYRQTVASTGDDSTAIVLRGGSGAEVLSVLSRENLVTVAQAPQVARNAGNVPLASAELVVAASLTRRGPAAEDGSVQLRGVDPIAWEVRPAMRIIAGRAPQSGRRELVVGRGARQQFAGLEPGGEIRLGPDLWQVVGVFESGDEMESEIWGDAG